MLWRRLVPMAGCRTTNLCLRRRRSTKGRSAPNILVRLLFPIVNVRATKRQDRSRRWPLLYSKRASPWSVDERCACTTRESCATRSSQSSSLGGEDWMPHVYVAIKGQIPEDCVLPGSTLLSHASRSMQNPRERGTQMTSCREGGQPERLYRRQCTVYSRGVTV